MSVMVWSPAAFGQFRHERVACFMPPARDACLFLDVAPHVFNAVMGRVGPDAWIKRASEEKRRREISLEIWIRVFLCGIFRTAKLGSWKEEGFLETAR
jgi:hypothetical protein